MASDVRLRVRKCRAQQQGSHQRIHVLQKRKKILSYIAQPSLPTERNKVRSWVGRVLECAGHDIGLGLDTVFRASEVRGEKQRSVVVSSAAPVLARKIDFGMDDALRDVSKAALGSGAAVMHSYHMPGQCVVARERLLFHA